MITIKEYIDKERINGQFVLTGSASLQGFKDISDSLAGRIGIVELYPLSLKEKHGKSENIIDILRGDLEPFILKKYDSSIISEQIIDGGYPEILKIESQKANTSATNKSGIFYYGTTDRKEIDFVLEFGEKVVAIEVKGSKSVSKDMFKHIYSLQKEMSNSF